MNKSESIKEIATALCKAQATMSGAVKGSVNPFFKSKYSDLNSVIDAIRIPFADNGLSYSQFPVYEENKVGVETMLMHTSGEWMSSVLLLPLVKHDPQAAGACITYARRYCLLSIAGIPAEDDDAESAMNRKPAPMPKPKPMFRNVQDALEAITDCCELKELRDVFVSATKQFKDNEKEMNALTTLKDQMKTEIEKRETHND